MSQSLFIVPVHVVLSTKGRRPLLRDEQRGELHAYITGILHNHDRPLLEINSVADHIHILFAQSKNHVPLGTLGVAVFSVEFSELESRIWKVSKIQVTLPNSKTVVLSDKFVQKMWSPGPDIVPLTAIEKEGITTVTISTGDGGESTSSQLEITKELTVVELM